MLVQEAEVQSQANCSDLFVSLLINHLMQVPFGPFSEEVEVLGRKRFHLGHFLDLVFINNCIIPPQNVTNHRL